MSMFCLDKLRLGGFMPVDGFSFRVWMESSVVDFHGVSGSWVNPDRIWKRQSVTFIYTDNKLYLWTDGSGLRRDSTHMEFLMTIPALREKVVGDPEKYVSERNARRYRTDKGLSECLFGRYMNVDMNVARSFTKLSGGTGVREYDESVNIVSFWNDEKEIYDKYLAGCMKALVSHPMYEKENYEGDEVPTLVSTPLIGTRYLPDVVSGVVSKVLSDEEKNRIAMHQKLHLMEPNEKKRAMAELGVGGVKVSRKGDWRDALRAGGYPPYLTQSESRC